MVFEKQSLYFGLRVLKCNFNAFDISSVEASVRAHTTGRGPPLDFLILDIFMAGTTIFRALNFLRALYAVASGMFNSDCKIQAVAEPFIQKYRNTSVTDEEEKIFSLNVKNFLTLSKCAPLLFLSFGDNNSRNNLMNLLKL